MSLVLTNLVLDHEGLVWRGDEAGWWRCLEPRVATSTVSVGLRYEELRAVRGPLTRLEPHVDTPPPVRQYAGSPPPPRKRPR